jgi:hypothetical protein
MGDIAALAALGAPSGTSPPVYAWIARRLAVAITGPARRASPCCVISELKSRVSARRVWRNDLAKLGGRVRDREWLILRTFS